MTRHVHVLGICGYAASGAAMLARQAGDRVTGSDDFGYPPVSDAGTAAGIEWENRSDPANLERWGVPDLVVVGNQTRATNPEFIAVKQRGLRFISEIEFYVSLVGDRPRLTVCGTHGKTTTAALLAHMLERAGLDPGFRLGALSLDLGGTSRLGSGPFVFEGDEYTTAPWDARPKFLHTKPVAACVTRIELDHPDVYPTLDAYRAPFIDMAATLPRGGTLALCADDVECVALRRRTPATAVTYGSAAAADWRVVEARWDGTMQRFAIERDGVPRREVTLTFAGVHNALNACAALILAVSAGAPEEVAVAACADFRGPARRFQVLGAGPVTVVDDYAHHPSEVAAAIAAARQRFGARRLIAVHTPHTYSRTTALLEDYGSAFAGADVAVIGPIDAARERGHAATVSSEDVAVRAASSVGDVHVVADHDDALTQLQAIAHPGDVVLVLSLGGFDKLAEHLVSALEGAGARR